MHNAENNVVVHWCTARKADIDISSISKTTKPINSTIFVRVQYFDIITNPRWQTSGMLKLAFWS